MKNTLKFSAQLFGPSLAGLLVGGVVLTPVIALMNYTARDGPIFPAPMVAFVLVLPLIMILFSIQVATLLYVWISKRYLGMAWIIIGLVAGGGAGYSMYSLLIAPYQHENDILALVSFLGLGGLLGLTIFGLQWAFNLLQLVGKPHYITSSKSEE